MVYVQPRIVLGEWDAQTPLGSWDANRSPNLGQTTTLYNNQERTCKIVDFAVPVNHWVKLKECEKRDKYLDLTRGLRKTVEHESDGYTNCNWCSWYSNQRIGKRTWGLGNKRTSGDNPNYSIAEIGQNTKKSPRDLRRLVGCLGFMPYQPL